MTITNTRIPPYRFTSHRHHAIIPLVNQAPGRLAVDYRKKWWVLAAVAMGTFLSTLDSSIVNVAIPTLERELDTTFANVQWVALAYMAVLATLLPGMGRLADMRGKKSIYVTGFVVFTLSSALCGLAPTIHWLILFRIVQGIGAAMITALGAAIVTENFPPAERGRALGITGVVVSLGIVTGPTLGGLLLQHFSWHAIFFVNVPVGIIGVWMVWHYVPRSLPLSGQHFDFGGAALLGAALLSLLLGLTVSQTTGWRSPAVLALLGACIVALLVFVLVERRVAQPMIDLELFRNVLFSVNLVTAFMIFIAIAGATFLMPFYLGSVLGYPIQQVGILLAVLPIGLGIMAPLAGYLSDRYGPRPITAMGLLVATVGFALSSTLQADTPTWAYVLKYAPVGIGIGLFNSPNNSAIMGAVPRARLGVASGLMGLTRLLGQTVGVATLGALWVAQTVAAVGGVPGMDVIEAPAGAMVAGLHDVLLIGAAVTGAALCLAVMAIWLERRQVAARGRPALSEEVVPTVHLPGD